MKSAKTIWKVELRNLTFLESVNPPAFLKSVRNKIICFALFSRLETIILWKKNIKWKHIYNSARPTSVHVYMWFCKHLGCEVCRSQQKIEVVPLLLSKHANPKHICKWNFRHNDLSNGYFYVLFNRLLEKVNVLRYIKSFVIFHVRCLNAARLFIYFFWIFVYSGMVNKCLFWWQR